MLQPRRRTGRQGRAGITLIEMLVVMTIIALFAALVGPSILKHGDTARITAARAQIHNFMTALGSYKLDTGTFPTTEQGLQALRVRPADQNQWAGPYMPQTSLKIRGPTTTCTSTRVSTATSRISSASEPTASLAARV